jgi:hypothetical protein
MNRIILGPIALLLLQKVSLSHVRLLVSSQFNCLPTTLTFTNIMEAIQHAVNSVLVQSPWKSGRNQTVV